MNTVYFARTAEELERLENDEFKGTVSVIPWGCFKKMDKNENHGLFRSMMRNKENQIGLRVEMPAICFNVLFPGV